MANIDLTYLTNLKGWVGQKDFSLDRIRTVARFLGNPQDRFRSIHVAGTNGKGSTSKVLSSILKAAGYAVGLYTSPHLVKINERIQVDGSDIRDQDLFNYSMQLKQASEKLKVELSQFETLTLISFLVFRDRQVDFAVIETGLGGRLDATNIISKPDISIITNVGLDHQDILGESIEDIAKEKSGIIKEGSTLIIGELPEKARNIILQKANLCSQVFEFKKDFNAERLFYANGRQGISFNSSSDSIDLNTSLLGKHQLNNVSLAVIAALALNIDKQKIQEGVEKAVWPGRLELIKLADVHILTDAAHNVPGVQAAVSFCDEYEFKPDIIVFGALGTKNWKEMILNISFKIKQWFILEAESTMAVSSKEIASFISLHELGETKLFHRDYDSVLKSLNSLPQNTNVLALGSIYILGKLKELLITRGYINE